MTECRHERTNPNGCMGCPAVFCDGCGKHHRGIPRVQTRDGYYGHWDHPNPGPCIARLKDAVGALGLIVATMALRERLDVQSWEEFDEACRKADEERDARQEEALRRDREAWRYVRD